MTALKCLLKDLASGDVIRNYFLQLSSQIVQDLVQSRWYMAGAVVAVVIICFIYILLLRWLVAPVVWISIAGLHVVLGFCEYIRSIFPIKILAPKKKLILEYQ